MDEHEVTVRNRIIESVFAKRNAAGDGPQESYAGHLKIWESEGGNDKPRYIILSGAFTVPHVVNNAVLLTHLQTLPMDP